ncbi:MAG TPA: PTS fructose-like transporter subunit IIB, partial [Longimicrobium sp.]|nr:PTS fructose-like transporter subunit IIB [Longimicrobium sp.]
MKIVSVTASPTALAHALLAAEALRATAEAMGHSFSAELHGGGAVRGALSVADVAAADVVVVAADGEVDEARFAGKPVHRVRTADAVRHTRAVLDAALALVPAPPSAAPSTADPASDANPSVVVSDPKPVEGASSPPAAGKRVVAITACPTGIAHTFMAAEALQKAAGALGHTIRVETQGSVGAKNALTDEEIAAADAVVIAAETKVDTVRFAGKPVYVTSTKHAMRAGREVIETALAQPASTAATGDAAADARPAKAEARTGPYKHLMTGVSYMLPVVIAGGLCIALAF